MDLASVLAQQATENAESWLRTATVTATSALPMVEVSLDGGTLLLPKIGGYYSPVIGDVVSVLCAPGRKLIIGKYGDGASSGGGTVGPAGPQGDPGPAGSTGPAGADGKTVRSGSGTPSAGLGVDGDFYINTAAWTIYGPKTAGAWGSPTSIVGPQGPAGNGGRVGSSVSTTAVNGITGTEQITDKVTFTAVAGRRYRATAQFQWDDATAGDEVFFRFRWATGATVVPGSTQFAVAKVSSLGTTPGNPRMPMILIREITGIPAGQATIGLGVVRNSGTGSVNREGAADNEAFLVIDDVGT